MQRQKFRIPLDSVDSPPLMTGTSLVEPAQTHRAVGEADLNFAVTCLHEGDGQHIVHAEIELCRGTEGDWCLQQISHPLRCAGLTAHVLLATRDLEPFAEARHGAAADTVTPICADELEAEGLGPLAMLDLRRGNRFPVVPSMKDRLQLLDLIEQEC